MRRSHPGGLARTLLALLASAGCAGGPTTATTPGEPGTPRVGIPPGPYVAGRSYYGRNRYVEYVAGDAPVILSAAHGGDLTPTEIPDRRAGACGGSATTTRDLNTRELVLAMQQRYHARFGRYPHVVINHLHRVKLDANRDVVEGACGSREAETAWSEFQAFLDVARDAAVRESGRGWYMDVHGHGHEAQRLELGYLLSGRELDLSDAALDASKAYEDTASIRTLSEQDTRHSFSAVLRGPGSLGTLYADNGFPSVPSSGDPGPRGAPYFDGGYNTRRHGCGAEAAPLGGVSGGSVCGVQVETNYAGIRDTRAAMDRFGDVTAAVLDTYLTLHWGLDLDAAAGRGTLRRPPPAATERRTQPERFIPSLRDIFP